MNESELTDSDYECAVLSCCIKDMNWPTAYAQATSLIEPRHFADANKGKIFEIMGKQKAQPDEFLLAEEANLPIHEILPWFDKTETSAHILRFSEGVLKRWTAREGNHIALEIMDSCKQGDDPKETLSSASKRISDALQEQGSSFVGIEEGLDNTLKHCMDMNEGKVQYLQTGLPDLDRVMGGFKNGEMSIIAGRPSQGKTALALSIAALIASRGERVLFASLEMSVDQLTKRLIHSVARVPIINGPSHYSTEDVEKLHEAVEKIRKWPLKIDQSSGITVPYLTAKAVAEKTRSGLDLLVIDYLGIMNGPGRDLYERMTNISKGVCQLAKTLDRPVLALSQLNRESEKDNNPSMRHLRDSGSLEQDADQVLMLKRRETGKFIPTEVMEAWVVKNRNGLTGTTPLTFVRSYARYESYAEEPKTRLN